jgi:patatin-like phospholipase/acyl hydrolase
LGAGIPAAGLLDLYARRGQEVFPPAGRLATWLRDKRHYVRYLYDREALQTILTDTLGGKLLGESRSRLCIPAFEGRHSEVFVFKTPHHSDYQTDRFESMINVALATAAAPSFFRVLEHDGYTLVDGGVWANNPVMLAVIEALTCFDVSREQIDVLSLGCGDERYVVSRPQIVRGGLWHWKNVIEAAMRLQSRAATNQVRLLLGPPQVVRIDAPAFDPAIRLDDWQRSVSELAPAAWRAAEDHGQRIKDMFLGQPAVLFTPAPINNEIAPAV